MLSAIWDVPTNALDAALGTDPKYVADANIALFLDLEEYNSWEKEAAVKAEDGRGDKDKGADDLLNVPPSEDVSPMEATA